MTNRTWKPFIRRRTKYSATDINASLSTLGELVISLGAFHALRSPAAISLFYDERSGLIGIAPAEAGSPNAVHLQKRKKAQQRNANLSEFIASFDITRPKTRIRFPNPTFDPDGKLVLNYAEAVGGAINDNSER